MPLGRIGNETSRTSLTGMHYNDSRHRELRLISFVPFCGSRRAYVKTWWKSARWWQPRTNGGSGENASRCDGHGLTAAQSRHVFTLRRVRHVSSNPKQNEYFVQIISPLRELAC